MAKGNEDVVFVCMLGLYKSWMAPIHGLASTVYFFFTGNMVRSPDWRCVLQSFRPVCQVRKAKCKAGALFRACVYNLQLMGYSNCLGNITTHSCDKYTLVIT